MRYDHADSTDPATLYKQVLIDLSRDYTQALRNNNINRAAKLKKEIDEIENATKKINNETEGIRERDNGQKK